MAVERMIRIVRTWDVPVVAEYGDTDEMLVEKANPGTIAEAQETRSILPERYETEIGEELDPTAPQEESL